MNWIIGLLIAVFLALGIYGSVQKNKRWEAFRTEHACKIISRSTPSTGVGLDTAGNMSVMTIEGKTGWLCDDGVTYYR